MYKVMYTGALAVAKTVNITSYIESRKNTKNLYFVMRFPADVTHILGDRESRSLRTSVMSEARDKAWKLYDRVQQKIALARRGMPCFDLTEYKSEDQFSASEAEAVAYLCTGVFSELALSTNGNPELTIRLLASYQNMKSGDWDTWFKQVAIDCGILLDPDSAMYATLKTRLQQSFMKLFAKSIQSHQQAVILQTGTDDLEAFEAANFKRDDTQKLKRPMMTIMEAWEDYKKKELVPKYKGHKREDEEITRFGNYVRDFSMYLNNPPLNYVTHEDVKNFFSELSKLPSRKTVKERGMTFLQLIELDHGRDTITKGTATEWYARLSRFYIDMGLTYRKQFEIDNPFEGMKKFVRGSKGTTKRAWEDLEIASLFTTPELTDPSKRNSFFYSVLCALTHGNRLSEFHERKITELVQDSAGIWYIKIEEAKNDDSERSIPISDIAIKAGFLEWVEKNKAAGAEYLFPDENHNDPDSRDFSRKFGKWLKRRGLYNEKRTFHNFRNTFLSMAQECQMPSDILNPHLILRRIAGHHIAKDVHETYIDTRLITLKRILDAVKIGGLPEFG